MCEGGGACVTPAAVAAIVAEVGGAWGVACGGSYSCSVVVAAASCSAHKSPNHYTTTVVAAANRYFTPFIDKS